MFNSVNEFEKQVAEFYGAPYSVATDCCTHALELCLRATNPGDCMVPTHTYISIPFTLIKLGLPWSWKSDEWHEYYYIGGTNIIDAAVFWQKDGYIPGTLMALSFQYKKHLSTIRGGMILLDDADLARRLKIMRYDGRPDLNRPWSEQHINEIGYHYYMTPETAVIGLQRLPQAISTSTQVTRRSYQDYPYLPAMPCFDKLDISIQS